MCFSFPTVGSCHGKTKFQNLCHRHTLVAKQLHTNLSSYRPVSLRRCAALAMHDKNTGSASIIQVNTGMQRLIAQGIVHKYCSVDLKPGSVGPEL